MSDRTCLSRLLQRNSVIASFRRNERLGDTSQNGNWSSFRNVMFNGTPVPSLNPSDFSPMPKQVCCVSSDCSGNVQLANSIFIGWILGENRIRFCGWRAATSKHRSTDARRQSVQNSFWMCFDLTNKVTTNYNIINYLIKILQGKWSRIG